MLLLLIIFSPLMAAFLLPVASRLGRGASAVAAAIGPSIALALLLQQLANVFAGETLRFHQPWLSMMGLDISLRLDGLSLLFALQITVIGLLVILYARYYLSPNDSLPRLYGLLAVFMTAMLGIVMSSNILLMIVFWELTSISSFLLISYWQDNSDARKGARMALTVTGAGGLALLAGAIVLERITGSFEFDVILAAGDIIRPHPLYPLALVLVLMGIFTKSAQFPFHFWLPQAMAAPTPVSAYLHSATMVKAGVFLLARMYPALGGTGPWFYIVTSIGLITLVFGACTALFKHDLKGLLAYSTISHLGLITLLFGLDTPLGVVAGLFHIVNHATFKASLFMAAGAIDHETGTRDMRKINGMWQFMPITATVAMVASAAMAGVPLLNGFLSKEMFFAETLRMQSLGAIAWIVPAFAIIAGIFAVAYSFRFIHDVFFNGKPIDLPIYPPHEPPMYMIVPMGILVGLCLMVGMLPNLTVAPFLAAASHAVLGPTIPDYQLAIWHGFNWPLAMSTLALIGGLALYSQRKKLFAIYDRQTHADSKRIFEERIQLYVRFARELTFELENGSLQRYLALFIGAVIIVAGVELSALPHLRGELPSLPVDFISVLAATVLMICAFGTVFLHHQRINALLCLGGVGLVVVLMFVRFAAPDLALTQLCVEVVTVVLILLALYFLPQRSSPETDRRRIIRDAILAVAVAVGLGLFTWAVLTRPHQSIAEFYLENSVSGGGGTNVVNVILVDFRGFDTLGEITVLLIALVAIQVLLRGLRLPLTKIHDAWSADAYPPILSILARILLPLALMVSAFLFLRGHNAPGGGFIAGLITSIALILQTIANGDAWIRQRFDWNYRRIAIAGVLLSTVTGLASWLFESPFLTSTFYHHHWPIIGDFELASAMVFDAGVYLAVVGSTLGILSNLGRLDTRTDALSADSAEVS